MPYARKRARPSYRRRRSTTSRKYRGLRRRGAGPRRMYRRSGVPRQLGTVVPQSALVKFRATDTWVYSAASGAFTKFYANNVYDPVSGASTTGCTGFAQIMAIYDRCTVFAYKCVATFSNIGAYPFLAFSCITDSRDVLGGTIPSRDYITEGSPNARYKFVVPAAFQQRTTTVKNFVKIKRLEHQRNLNPADYSCTSISGPTKLCNNYIGILITPSSGSTVAANVFIRHTYYCRCFGRKDIGA